jgi:hypothetical protein
MLFVDVNWYVSFLYKDFITITTFMGFCFGNLTGQGMLFNIFEQSTASGTYIFLIVVVFHMSVKCIVVLEPLVTKFTYSCPACLCLYLTWEYMLLSARYFFPQCGQRYVVFDCWWRRLWCDNRFLLAVNCLSHVSHWNNLSEWVSSKCLFRFASVL